MFSLSPRVVFPEFLNLQTLLLRLRDKSVIRRHRVIQNWYLSVIGLQLSLELANLAQVLGALWHRQT